MNRVGLSASSELLVFFFNSAERSNSSSVCDDRILWLDGYLWCRVVSSRFQYSYALVS